MDSGLGPTGRPGMTIGSERDDMFIPLVPAQAGTQLLDSRFRGNERLNWSSPRRPHRFSPRAIERAAKAIENAVTTKRAT
jgi:hypothetical protein